jgi:hypothetical protein
MEMAEQPPQVNAGPNRSTRVGETMELDFVFTAPDGVGPYSAEIDWGDGSAVQDLGTVTPNTAYEVAHVYAAEGAYTIEVTITDDGGLAGGGDEELCIGVDEVAVGVCPSGAATLPQAANDSATIAEDSSLTFNVLANDIDTEMLELVTNGFYGEATITEENEILYTPYENWHGTDFVLYTTYNAYGRSDAGVLAVTVTPVNDAPVAYDNERWTEEDAPILVRLDMTDVDGDELTYTITNAPDHGTLTLFDEYTAEYEYEPDPGYHGPDSFTFTVSDGTVTTDPATVDITIDKVHHVGSEPVALAAGDFNGDGDQDAITANYDDDNISVLFGDGEGSFADAVQFNVGSEPVALAAGTINSDSHLDLAVVNQNANTVSILLNNGSGGFTLTSTLSVGTAPSAIALADFDEDGVADLAVANRDNDNVTLYLGNGDGTFATGTTITVGDAPASIAVGDLNGDGHKDLIVANRDSDNVSIRLGVGDGTFTSPTTSEVTVGDAPLSVIVGLFNDDSHLDVAVANSLDDTVMVMPGQGNGGFGTADEYDVGWEPVALATGDLNDDGLADIAAANKSSDNVSVLYGQESGEMDNAGTFYYGGGQYLALAVGYYSDDPAPWILAAAGVGSEVRPGQAAQQGLRFKFEFGAGVTQEMKDAIALAASYWTSALMWPDPAPAVSGMWVRDNVELNIKVEIHANLAAWMGTSSNETKFSYATVRRSFDIEAKDGSQKDKDAYNSLPAGQAISALMNYVQGNTGAATGSHSHSELRMHNANAKAFGLVPSKDQDAVIGINPKPEGNGVWDYNPLNDIAADQYDFVGTFVHEIGHVMGFGTHITNHILHVGENKPVATAGTFPPTILDLFRFSAASTQAQAIDLAIGDADRYFSLDRGQTVITKFNGSKLGKSQGPNHWEANKGFMSEWKMGDPILRKASEADKTLFDVLGWTLKPPA